MSYEEKGVWVYLVVTTGVYIAYAVIVLGAAASTPLSEVDYVAPLLWSIGIAIVAAIIGRILVEMARPSESYKGDDRDRDIARRGDAVGYSFLVLGALGALVLAVFEAEYFWIANALYLGFTLMAIVGSIAKIVSYRRGLAA